MKNIKHTVLTEKKSEVALSMFDKREFKKSKIQIEMLMNLYSKYFLELQNVVKHICS